MNNKDDPGLKPREGDSLRGVSNPSQNKGLKNPALKGGVSSGVMKQKNALRSGFQTPSSPKGVGSVKKLKTPNSLKRSGGMHVSVVIPTFERPHFLSRLLTSIAKQTYRQFEVIVVDDASSEQSQYQEVIHTFTQELPALTYLRNDSNRGAPYSRNRGILQAQGEAVALVDDDDEWLPTKLEKQVALLKSTPRTTALVYTWTKAMRNGKCVFEYKSEYEGNVLRELLLDCFIPSPSVIVRKEALLETGLFDLEMPSCQDWDLWTRLLARGYQCGVVKSFETLYHQHEGITIGSSPQASKGYDLFFKKHLPLYKKYHPLFYYKLLFKMVLKKWLFPTVRRLEKSSL